MEKIKLFCLPYAGGSATVYSRWSKGVGEEIEIIPVELAGRGRRTKEKLYDSMDEAVADLYAAVQDQLNGTYAFFGHSMGSLLTYELVHKIKREGHAEPVHVFFSGRKPPHARIEPTDYHAQPDEVFQAEVARYGGSARQLFENKQLTALFMPILRSDFKIIETYEYKQPLQRLQCDITVLSGDGDADVSMEDVLAWQETTDGRFQYQIYNGSHFFINEVTEQVLQLVRQTLLEAGVARR